MMNKITITSFKEPQQPWLLYSWRFSCNSAPIHWLVHGHMTSNNETASRQMPWAGNIAKTMTSNVKQFTVTREILTAVARDHSVQLKVALCFRPNLSFFQNLLLFSSSDCLYNGESSLNAQRICPEKKLLALLIVKIPKIRSWWQKLPWIHLEPSEKKKHPD